VALAVVGLATGLTLAGVPLTSAQGTVLYVSDVTDRLPNDDPWSPAWDGVRGVEVPLSPQVGVPPALLEPSVPTVRARALTDGDRIAILLEWADSTVDQTVLRSDAFADAVAIQFAQGAGVSICMGQQAGSLNIWHWKADWAADLEQFRDVPDAHPNMPLDATVPYVPRPDSTPRPGPDGFLSAVAAGNLRSLPDRASAVEDLNAVGFGSLTVQPADRQNVLGASEYRGGVWRVVLSRSLATDDPNDARLRRDGSSVVALAVWDGARGERDGLKSTSGWLALAFAQHGPGFLDAWPFLVMMLMAILGSGVLIVYGSRQPAIGLGWHAAEMEPPVPTEDSSQLHSGGGER